MGGDKQRIYDGLDVSELELDVCGSWAAMEAIG